MTDREQIDLYATSTNEGEGMPTSEALIRRLREEIERLERDLAISHAAQSASAEGWHQAAEERDKYKEKWAAENSDHWHRIEAALALHTKAETSEWTVCDLCSCYDGGGVVPWPCPTVKALKGEESK